MHKNKIYILTIIITILLFIFLFSKIEIRSVVEAIKILDIRLFFIATVISVSVNIFLGAEQWKQSLKICNLDISFLETLLIKLGSMPAKRLLPLKMGEMAKPLYLKKVHNFPLSRGIFSVFLPIFLNSFTAVLFILFGMHISEKMHISWYIIILLFLTVIIFGRQLFLRYYKNVNITKIIPFISLFIISLIYISSEVIVVYILFNTFGVDISFYNFLIFVPLIIFITNIPITFQGLGTREICVVFFFSKYADAGLLLSIGIIYSFIEGILPLLISMFFLKGFLNKFYA